MYDFETMHGVLGRMIIRAKALLDVILPVQSAQRTRWVQSITYASSLSSGP